MSRAAATSVTVPVAHLGRIERWARSHLPGLLAGLLVAAGSLLVLRGVSNPGGADWGVTSLVVVTALLMVGIAAASTRLSSAHQLSLVGALAAFATASRLLFASLPNFKPVTFVVLCSGAALGPAPGFMIGATTALVSNLFFGQGPWTPWQMLAWGVIGAVGGFLGLGGRRPHRWELVVVGAVGAVAFDWFVTLWMYLAFTARTWPALIALYAQGLVFDASHAAATILFTALFGVQMVELIARFRRRTEVRLLPFEEGSAR